MGKSPDALKSPLGLGLVNPTIELVTSAGRLTGGKRALDLDRVQVRLRSIPSLSIEFEGSTRSADPAVVRLAFDRWEPRGLSLPEFAGAGRTYQETVQLGGDFRRSVYRVRARGQLRTIRLGRGRRFGSALFHLPNFPHFVGLSITDENAIWRGRLILNSSPWRVCLDARREISDLVSGLREMGGHAFTHVCRIDQGGRPFGRAEAAECLDALHWFLSFVAGKWTAPMLIHGRSKGGHETFREWSDGRVDPGIGGFRWCDETVWASAQEAFVGYMSRWSDPAWQQGLRVAIGQYISSNKPNPIEGAIISAQSGLELLAWLHLVEDRRAVRAPDWDRRRGDWKIRELLRLAKIDPMVPPGLSRLLRLNPSWKDGPDVIAGVRNDLVHPTRAGGRVGWPSEVLLDAWLLASRYLELVLLFSIGVTGPIRNRLNPNVWVGSVEKPPWTPGGRSPRVPPRYWLTRYEPRALRAKHRVRVDPGDSESLASVRDLDLPRACGLVDLLGHRGVPVSMSVSHEVVVGCLKELVDDGLGEGLRLSPLRHFSQAVEHRHIGGEEEATSPDAIPRPIRQLVAVTKEFLGNLLDAEDLAVRIGVHQPVPEGRYDIQAVVLVLGLDEHVGVEQVTHPVTPSFSVNSWKVDSFLKPSIWNASR